MSPWWAGGPTAGCCSCLRSHRALGTSVRGPTDAWWRGADHRRSGIRRRLPRHLFGGASTGADLTILHGIRSTGPRDQTGGARDRLRQSASGPARSDRLPRPEPHLRRTEHWQTLTPPTGAAAGTRREHGEMLLGDKPSIPPDAITAMRVMRRIQEQGEPGGSWMVGVGVEAISSLPSTSAPVGIMLATLGHTVG